MVSLGQKLKMLKTCEKLFYKNIVVVLCKKPLLKTANIGEMRPFLKSSSSKAIAHGKTIGFAKWSVWVKN